MNTDNTPSSDKQGEQPVTNYPTDWAKWKASKEGKDCLQWPVTELRFLENRLWYAFMAGVKSMEPEGKECLPVEKPDFEKMAIKLYPAPYHVNDIDITPAIRDGFTQGCEKFWNDYYLPAQKRIAELEAKLSVPSKDVSSERS